MLRPRRFKLSAQGLTATWEQREVQIQSCLDPGPSCFIHSALQTFSKLSRKVHFLLLRGRQNDLGCTSRDAAATRIMFIANHFVFQRSSRQHINVEKQRQQHSVKFDFNITFINFVISLPLKTDIYQHAYSIQPLQLISQITSNIHHNYQHFT